MVPTSSQKIGLASLPLLATLSVIFGVFGLGAGLVYDSTILYGLVSVLVLSVGLAVARVAAKSFLSTGSVNVNLLGDAVLLFAATAVLGGFVLTVNVEGGIAIHVIGSLLAGCLHLTGGLLTVRNSPRIASWLRLRVGVSYGMTLAFSLVVSVLAVETNLLAGFGRADSLFEQVAVIATVIVFFAAAITFAGVYFRSHSPVIYWYSLALATTAFAVIAFSMVRTGGDIPTWVGLGGLGVGSLYFLRTVLVASKQRSHGGLKS